MSTGIANNRKSGVLPKRGKRCAGRSRPCEPKEAALRSRARRLLSQPIEFVPTRSVTVGREESLPGDLTESRRLSAAEEQALFRRMNQAKYRASVFLGLLDQAGPAVPRMDEIERLLNEARQIRDGLVTVFLKLAKTVVKMFASQRHLRDELLAEAYVSLLRAVELFDTERGFRFSSYAIPAIRSNLRRYLDKRRREGLRSVDLGTCDFVVDSGRWTVAYQSRIERATVNLDQMLSQLRPREEAIIRCRFGLGMSPGVHTLQQLASEWGVTRERVRQLEQRALEKLRDLIGPELQEWDDRLAGWAPADVIRA